MKKENINNKTNCHSQVSLLGISTLVKQSGGDPRLQASGMTDVYRDEALNKNDFRAPLRSGFTLLEILIAVVIIAVLAAIAVSAYQKVVLKSRFSAVIPPTKTTAEAQEFHYMREGSYATDTEDLDVKLNNDSNTITVSDKRNYKYVMGTPNGAANNHYIVYQKHSKRFAGDIHCEAQKDDARANWLCAESLGGTLLTGSINGSDWLTYLLSGDGNGKFVREDCATGQYDDNGTCRPAPAYYYADEGELKKCPPGTSTRTWVAASSCIPCPAGSYNDEEGQINCKLCNAYSYQPATGATSCIKCPPGTSKNGSWSDGSTSCIPCAEGEYTDTEGSIRCKSCPSGTTSNEDHTGCVPA